MQRGFVLFSVLLFLQIFACLGLYGITTVKLMLRALYDREQYQLHLKMANILLLKIEALLINGVPRCFIPITANSLLVNRANEWWQEQSCHGNFDHYQYSYVVEWLGKDACTHVIKHDNDHNGLAEYYRITLRLIPAHFTKIFLQSIIVKAHNDPMPCSDVQHVIKEGRQTWRELVGSKKFEGYYPIIKTQWISHINL